MMLTDLGYKMEEFPKYRIFVENDNRIKVDNKDVELYSYHKYTKDFVYIKLSKAEIIAILEEIELMEEYLKK